MDFSQLKKNRGSRLKEMVAKTKQQEQKNYRDDRFWKPFLDKEKGKGIATVRFLPPKDTETPWVKIWDHSFKANGQFVIENCLTSIEKDCPICDMNSKLWEMSDDDDKTPEKEQARDQKRRLAYISNILVVSDPSRPENEGKVFLWKYGPSVFKKIRSAMIPEFDDEEGFDPFDFWDGANFLVKTKFENRFWNYDSSSFGEFSSLSDDDAELKEVFDTMYGLSEFVSDGNFHTYEEIQARLERVSNSGTIGLIDLVDVFGGTKKSKSAEEVESDKPKRTRKAPKYKVDDEDEDDVPPKKTEAEEDDVPWDEDEKVEETPVKKKKPAKVSVDDDDDDDFDFDSIING